jgi:hypothetical protein
MDRFVLKTMGIAEGRKNPLSLACTTKSGGVATFPTP